VAGSSSGTLYRINGTTGAQTSLVTLQMTGAEVYVDSSGNAYVGAAQGLSKASPATGVDLTGLALNNTLSNIATRFLAFLQIN
jgi:hypothetical protein